MVVHSTLGMRLVQGNNQSGAVSTALSTVLKVQVFNAGTTTTAAGVVVEWVDPTLPTVIIATSTTDSTGTASYTWTMPGVAGLVQLTARVRSEPRAAVTFSATATAGTSTGTIAAASTTSQTATKGTAVGVPPSVRVTDTDGNVVSGKDVIFTMTAGSGTLSPVSPATVTTDANGLATLTSWTLGAAAGTNTVTAALAGYTGSPVTFNATGANALPTQIAKTSGDAQTNVTAGAAATAFTATVKDVANAAVQNVDVLWTILTGAGTLTGGQTTATATTDASGVTTTTLTTNATVGSFSVTASFVDATGTTQSVTFTGSTVAGASTKWLIRTQPSSNVSSGTPFSQQPILYLADANSNAVATAGVVCTAARASGSDTLAGTLTATTDSTGTATFVNLTFNAVGAGGNNTLQFTGGSKTAATSNTVAVAPPIPVAVAWGTQPTGGTSGITLAPFTVRVVDNTGTTVPAATDLVTLSLFGSGGTIGGTVAVNASAGVATFSNVTVTGAGSFSFDATSGTFPVVRSSAFTISAAGADYPNKPAGLTTIGEFFCNKTNVEIGDYPVKTVTGVTGKIAVNGNTGSLLTTYGVTDATAPYGTDQVRRIRYAASAFNGTAPANLALWNAATNTNFYTTQYLCYVWKFVGDGSGTFEFHASVTKQFWIASGTSGDSSNYFCVPGNGSQTPRSQYKYEFRQQGAFSGQCNRPQNGAGSSYQHTVGHWYRTEILVTINNAANNSGGHAIYGGTNITLGDGTFKLYERDLTAGETSSTLIMDYSDICWKDAGTNNRNFKFHYWNGTFGGGPATKTQSDDIYIARMHIAGS